MKICEYDHISCPSCGETKPGNKNRGLMQMGKVTVRRQGMHMLGHLIHCLSCSIDFVIPCED
jgi:hypothetical protein